MDRRASWDVRDDLPAAPAAAGGGGGAGGGGQGRRRVPVDALGNLQAPGAHRQFSLELTTYASIPVRAERSGFRPPHRSAAIVSISQHGFVSACQSAATLFVS